MEDFKQDIANSHLIYSVVRNFPNPVLYENETLNSSSKTFTVPAEKIWDIEWIYIELTTTATAGDRLISIQICDSDLDVLLELVSGTTQSASTTRSYICIEGNYRETSFVNDTIEIPLPIHSFLPPGYIIKIWDKNNIDSTADDMIVHMVVNEWSISTNE